MNYIFAKFIFNVFENVIIQKNIFQLIYLKRTVIESTKSTIIDNFHKFRIIIKSNTKIGNYNFKKEFFNSISRINKFFFQIKKYKNKIF